MGRLRISYQFDSSSRTCSHGYWTIFSSCLRCLLVGKLMDLNSCACVVPCYFLAVMKCCGVYCLFCLTVSGITLKVADQFS